MGFLMWVRRAHARNGPSSPNSFINNKVEYCFIFILFSLVFIFWPKNVCRRCRMETRARTPLLSVRAQCEKSAVVDKSRGPEQWTNEKKKKRPRTRTTERNMASTFLLSRLLANDAIRRASSFWSHTCAIMDSVWYCVLSQPCRCRKGRSKWERRFATSIHGCRSMCFWQWYIRTKAFSNWEAAMFVCAVRARRERYIYIKGESSVMRCRRQCWQRADTDFFRPLLFEHEFLFLWCVGEDTLWASGRDESKAHAPIHAHSVDLPTHSRVMRLYSALGFWHRKQ